MTSSYSKPRPHTSNKAGTRSIITTDESSPHAPLSKTAKQCADKWTRLSTLLQESMAITFAKKLNELREPRRTKCELEMFSVIARHRIEQEDEEIIYEVVTP